MQLETIIRAPFIVPGRRNRKVYWDRALSKTKASLGRFEREDWIRGLILPRPFRDWPQFNNQFSPGGGSGCGCCGGGNDEFCEVYTSQCADQYEVEFGVFGNVGCANCDADFSNATFVLTRRTDVGSECIWTYWGPGGTCNISATLVGVSLGLNGGADSVSMLVESGGAAMLWNAIATDLDCANYSNRQFDDATPSNLACIPSPSCFVTAI